MGCHDTTFFRNVTAGKPIQISTNGKVLYQMRYLAR
jgi:hypothetical protein